MDGDGPWGDTIVMELPDTDAEAVQMARQHPVLAKLGSAICASWALVLDLQEPLDGIVIRFCPHPGAERTVLRRKLFCLAHGLEINDEVLNLYMVLLTVRRAVVLLR